MQLMPIIITLQEEILYIKKRHDRCLTSPAAQAGLEMLKKEAMHFDAAVAAAALP